MTPHGQFHWNELNARDPDAAMDFYQRQIGWTYQSIATPEGGPYWLALSAGVPAAGIIPHVGGEIAPKENFWTPYLSVDDVDGLTDKAVAGGAKIVRPLWDVPEVGRRVVLQEPGGALVAWMTPRAE